MLESCAQFSAFITGFSVIELQGTGLIDSYRELLREILGDKLFATFCESSQSVINARIQSEREQQFQKLFVSSEMFWPVVSNLISRWYLGVWNALPDDWYHA